VLRGGSWPYYAFYCRTAFRINYYPSFNHFDFGFRSVLPAGQ
jgi:formylglycine-generating enzyme required for sulfatase activity